MINMLSATGHIIPIDFNLSSALCLLRTDTLRMIYELGDRVLLSHTEGITERIVNIKEVEGRQHRAMLSLKTDGELDKGLFFGLV